MSVFTDAEREYLSSATLGRIATVGPDGQPHVVPVTFAFNADEDTSTSAASTSATARSGGTPSATRG